MHTERKILKINLLVSVFWFFGLLCFMCSSWLFYLYSYDVLFLTVQIFPSSLSESSGFIDLSSFSFLEKGLFFFILLFQRPPLLSIINISTPLLVSFDSSPPLYYCIYFPPSSSFLSALSFLYVSRLISVFSLSSFPFSLSLFLPLPHFPFFLSQTFTSFLTYHHSSYSILFLSRKL